MRTESFDGWVLDSAAAYASYQTHAAVIEPLLRFSENGLDVDPGLADEWSANDDDTRWTFHIRDGATFSDGTSVTADDVVFSEEVWARGPNFGGSFSSIGQVKAVDDDTVRFVMASPNATLPALLAGSVAGVMPADFGGRTEEEYYQSPIGAGPYAVTDWSLDGQIDLSRNEHYYDPARPAFDNVEITVVPDENERAILFQAGDADIVEYVGAPSAAQYDAGVLPEIPPGIVNHVSLNTTRAPFDDVELRRAVAQAIDYQSIVDGPLAGFASAPTGLLPPNLANSVPPSVAYFTTDREQAADALGASSGAGGFTTELIYDSGVVVDGQIAQIIQANLAEVGIEVTLTGLETGAFLDRAFALDADMVLWSFGAISPDVSDPLGWILGTGYLFSGLDDTELAERRDEYLSATSVDERRQIISEIQDSAVEDVPAIALAESRVIHAVAPYLGGFAPAPWGLYYYDTVAPAS